MEKRYSNALTPLSYIIFSSDYFFQSFCNIWVSLTSSDNSFTISPHNSALLHSIFLHSYPVPLTANATISQTLTACRAMQLRFLKVEKSIKQCLSEMSLKQDSCRRSNANVNIKYKTLLIENVLRIKENELCMKMGGEWDGEEGLGQGVGHMDGSRIFMGGGGVQKIMCANAHYEHKTRSPFRQGSRACLRALEALGVLMLSCAI